MDFPNSISSDALESLLKKTQDDEEHCPNCEMLDRVEAEVDKLFDTLPDPLLHKLVVLNLLSRLLTWHETIAEQHLQNKCEVSLAWAADAGRLAAAHGIIRKVAIGENDFTAKDQDD